MSGKGKNSDIDQAGELIKEVCISYNNREWIENRFTGIEFFDNLILKWCFKEVSPEILIDDNNQEFIFESSKKEFSELPKGIKVLKDVDLNYYIENILSGSWVRKVDVDLESNCILDLYSKKRETLIDYFGEFDFGAVKNSFDVLPITYEKVMDLVLDPKTDKWLLVGLLIYSSNGKIFYDDSETPVETDSDETYSEDDSESDLTDSEESSLYESVDEEDEESDEDSEIEESEDS